MVTSDRRGTTRAQTRENTERLILESARRHLATDGPAGLSLRAIARDIGVVSSAVYRYVANRDELLTKLLVEGYTDLADEVAAAIGRVGDGSARERLQAAANAMRAWGAADPSRWALLYGSPVPGYSAPAEQTGDPGTRVIAMILGEIAAAEAAGALHIDAADTDDLHSEFGAIRTEFDADLSDSALLVAMSLWATVIGAISLEVFGQYGADTFDDPATLFDAQIARLLASVID
ncbi:TetR/AcrR family transcriptional regulator [Gordonia jinhuaensis]|uniref:TetR family transcriptional regulator n=1 Tax=Gordonia jinhuaensis TaxID=1517702 RepID=A0A916WNI4_9ACTN|nr:TetR/AcrR family transcriptional regulator [Gordonia jinhuaensis]GGB19390.1 TetR family transcriptional regulator [Gordonia jinhuaensis]